MLIWLACIPVFVPSLFTFEVHTVRLHTVRLHYTLVFPSLFTSHFMMVVALCGALFVVCASC
jgi:hypothetical protein